VSAALTAAAGAFGGASPRAEFNRNGSRGNRTALKALVNDSTVPGLLAYRGRTGIVSTFRRAGFVEEARPSPRTRIMRKYLA